MEAYDDGNNDEETASLYDDLRALGYSRTAALSGVESALEQTQPNDNLIRRAAKSAMQDVAIRRSLSHPPEVPPAPEYEMLRVLKSMAETQEEMRVLLKELRDAICREEME